MRKSYSGDVASFRLYDRQQRVVKLVTRRSGESMVRRGTATAINDANGVLCCFLLVHESGRSKQNALRVLGGSEASSSVFDRKEVEAIAGRHFRDGRSRTARMTEEQRKKRANRGLPVEDVVERATNKLRAWGEIGNLLAEVKVADIACL